MKKLLQFARKDAGEKVVFLFKMYDVNGDGTLTEKELEEVIRLEKNWES